MANNINKAIIINLSAGDATNICTGYILKHFKLSDTQYIIGQKDLNVKIGPLTDYGHKSLEDTLENLFISLAETCDSNYIRLCTPICEETDHILTIKTNYYGQQGRLPKAPPTSPYQYI